MKFESSHPSGGEIENSKETRKNGTTRRDFLKFMGRGAFGVAAAGGTLKKLEKAAEALEGRENPEAWHRDWKELKKIMEEAAAKENIRYLKEKFGKAGDAFFFKPLWDLQLVEFAKKTEAKEGDLRKTDSGKKLLEELSKIYRWFWSQKDIDGRLQARERKEPFNTAIQGFEALPGWSNERVRKLLESSFNQRWLYGNISAFQYINRHETQAHYRVAGRAAGQGIQSVLIKGEKQRVEIYRAEERLRDESLLRIMAHEIGHHQDWENNNRLPIQERLQFLREVTARFESRNRLQNHYVDEDIPKEYADKKLDHTEMLYRQIREYWASIITLYTIDSEALRHSNPEDYLLVKEWYERIASD